MKPWKKLEDLQNHSSFLLLICLTAEGKNTHIYIYTYIYSYIYIYINAPRTPVKKYMIESCSSINSPNGLPFEVCMISLDDI